MSCISLLRKSICQNALSFASITLTRNPTASIALTRTFQSSATRNIHLNSKCLISNSILQQIRSSQYVGTLLNRVSTTNALCIEQKRFLPTLNQIRRKKPRTKRTRPKIKVPLDRRILFGPQRKGICVKCVVRTPRKPNSAQRKCAVLRLNNGKLITAYIPGEKSNLQEHGVVLFRGGRVQDCPGLKYKIIRGVYDMN